MADENEALDQADEETLLDLEEEAQLEDNQPAQEAIEAELEKRGLDATADDADDEEVTESHPS